MKIFDKEEKMLKEIKLKQPENLAGSGVSEKKFIPCSCGNCGIKVGSIFAHADNTSIQPE